MEQRDLLKEQIEQMGRLLGKILADFLGLKTQGKVSQAMEIANEQFKDQLNIDIQFLQNLSLEDFKKYISEQKYSPDHLDILARYFMELGTIKRITSQPQALGHFQKSLLLLEHANNISSTASFERLNLMQDVKNLSSEADNGEKQ